MAQIPSAASAERNPESWYRMLGGAIEAMNAAEEESGLDRPFAEIDRWGGLPLRAGPGRIAEAVNAWSGGPSKDDISLLAIERTG